MFRGREDVYAKRYYSFKTGKSGYVPACKNEWEPDLCDKKAHRCPDCPNRAFVHLTAQVVRTHHGDLGPLAETEDPKQWPVNRKRKTLSAADSPIQVRLMVSNLIYVDKNGFSQGALNAVKRLAAFRNPEFYKKQAMRLRIYDTPRIIDCGWEDEDFLGIPRGCLDALVELLDAFEVPYTLEDGRQNGRLIDISFRGELRPEQQLAAKALLTHDVGVLSAATAFVKTVVAAYLIGQRKVNTLILVLSSDLLEQWKASLEQFLNI